MKMNVSKGTQEKYILITISFPADPLVMDVLILPLF